MVYTFAVYLRNLGHNIYYVQVQVLQIVSGEIGDIEAKPNDLKGLFNIKDFKNIKNRNSFTPWIILQS